MFVTIEEERFFRPDWEMQSNDSMNTSSSEGSASSKEASSGKLCSNPKWILKCIQESLKKQSPFPIASFHITDPFDVLKARAPPFVEESEERVTDTLKPKQGPDDTSLSSGVRAATHMEDATTCTPFVKDSWNSIEVEIIFLPSSLSFDARDRLAGFRMAIGETLKRWEVEAQEERLRETACTYTCFVVVVAMSSPNAIPACPRAECAPSRSSSLPSSTSSCSLGETVEHIIPCRPSSEWFRAQLEAYAEQVRATGLGRGDVAYALYRKQIPVLLLSSLPVSSSWFSLSVPPPPPSFSSSSVQASGMKNDPAKKQNGVRREGTALERWLVYHQRMGSGETLIDALTRFWEPLSDRPFSMSTPSCGMDDARKEIEKKKEKKVDPSVTHQDGTAHTNVSPQKDATASRQQGDTRIEKETEMAKRSSLVYPKGFLLSVESPEFVLPPSSWRSSTQHFLVSLGKTLQHQYVTQRREGKRASDRAVAHEKSSLPEIIFFGPDGYPMEMAPLASTSVPSGTAMTTSSDCSRTPTRALSSTEDSVESDIQNGAPGKKRVTASLWQNHPTTSPFVNLLKKIIEYQEPDVSKENETIRRERSKRGPSMSAVEVKNSDVNQSPPKVKEKNASASKKRKNTSYVSVKFSNTLLTGTGDEDPGNRARLEPKTSSRPRSGSRSISTSPKKITVTPVKRTAGRHYEAPREPEYYFSYHPMIASELATYQRYEHATLFRHLYAFRGAIMIRLGHLHSAALPLAHWLLSSMGGAASTQKKEEEKEKVLAPPPRTKRGSYSSIALRLQKMLHMHFELEHTYLDTPISSKTIFLVEAKKDQDGVDNAATSPPPEKKNVEKKDLSTVMDSVSSSLCGKDAEDNDTVECNYAAEDWLTLLKAELPWSERENGPPLPMTPREKERGAPEGLKPHPPEEHQAGNTAPLVSPPHPLPWLATTMYELEKTEEALSSFSFFQASHTYT